MRLFVWCSHYRCPSCRTRMFWSDDGDEGESGDGEIADGGEGDGDEETMDEHEEMSDEEDENYEEDDGFEEEDGLDDSDRGSDDVASDVMQSPSSSSPLTMSSTEENGVAQRLVNAIFHALSSSSVDGENDLEDGADHDENVDAVESTHDHRTS